MPRDFTPATAEQVAATAEAVVAFARPVDSKLVADFVDLTVAQAANALRLGVDLGLLSTAAGTFIVSNPICKMLRTPQEQERAAVLRILIEQFEPFRVFSAELEATGDASEAATRTKQILDLTAHREEIKDTLLSLATYSGALVAAHGGRYERDSKSVTHLLKELFAGCQEAAAAIYYVRSQLGAAANTVSHGDVLEPIAAAIRFAAGGDAREAVLHAGNAVESFLNEYAVRKGIPLVGGHGINAKLDKIQAAKGLPKKLINVGKYLGHVRNAADHGVDAEIGAAWVINDSTGLNFVSVAISFIRSSCAYEHNRHEL